MILKKTGEGVYDIVGEFQGHKRQDKANSNIINQLIKDYKDRKAGN